MYTVPAYVKLKKEEHQHLLDILATKFNYKVVHFSDFDSNKDIFVFTCIFNNTLYITNDMSCIDTKDLFNCEDNIDAFIGVIAIRDDSDIYQYWVDEEGASWVNLGMWIEPGSLSYCVVKKKVECFNSPKEHKASPEEILNYWKKRKTKYYA